MENMLFHIRQWCPGRAGFLFILLCILALPACDQGQQTDQTNGKKAVTTLRFGHDMPTDSAQHIAALKYSQLIEQRSNGRLRITIHPEQTLGNDHEMIAMAQAGELDIILPPTAKLSSLVPAFQLIDLPFFFHDRQEVYRVLDGPAGMALFKKLQFFGLTGVSYWESGFKQLTLDRAIRKASDLAGLKFRVMRSGVLRDQFKAWGAETIAIDFGKTRQALADAIVNGQENPLGSIYNMKFHEVQSHLILSQHGYLAQVLAFSNISLSKLSADLKDILLTSAQELTGFQRIEAEKREHDYLHKIQQSPIRVIELNEKIRQQLNNKSRSIMEKHRLQIGTDIVELALQSMDDEREFKPDELIIALDADLAGNSAISGLAIRRGIEIAIHEINNHGGVLGKKIRLVARDNSMVSARGLDNLQRFSKIPNLVAVFGGISSPVALSELEMIHENKILYLDPWAAATAIVENHHQPNYVFRVSVRDEYAAGFLLKSALKVSDKVALLLANNDWGRSSQEAISREMSQRGLTLSTQKWFDWGDSNLAAKLDDIQQSGAKVIIYVGNVVEAANIFKYMAEKNIQLPVISHWGVAGGDLAALTGADLNKVNLRVLQTFSFVGNKSKQARKVAALYKQLYATEIDDDIVAPVGTAHAYDLTHLLAMAIQKAGRLDMPSIRTAMEQLGKYQGLVRTYNPAFTAMRHDALNQTDYFLATYKNGILLPVQQ